MEGHRVESIEKFQRFEKNSPAPGLEGMSGSRSDGSYFLFFSFFLKGDFDDRVPIVRYPTSRRCIWEEVRVVGLHKGRISLVFFIFSLSFLFPFFLLVH
jgi:hypothetical protein